MVATAEDVVGLPPMGIVDPARHAHVARVLSHADYRPYTPRRPTVVPYGDPAAPTNGAHAPMAAAAARWNLKVEDKAPEIALNQSIWKSIRGRRARMPSPRHTPHHRQHPGRPGRLALQPGWERASAPRVVAGRGCVHPRCGAKHTILSSTAWLFREDAPAAACRGSLGGRPALAAARAPRTISPALSAERSRRLLLEGLVSSSHLGNQAGPARA